MTGDTVVCVEAWLGCQDLFVLLLMSLSSVAGGYGGGYDDRGGYGGGSRGGGYDDYRGGGGGGYSRDSY